MPIYDFAVAAGEDRDLEAELAYRGAHAIDSAIVLAWIARILYEAGDRPNLDVVSAHNFLLLLWHVYSGA